MNIKYQLYVAKMCFKNRHETVKKNKFLSFITLLSIFGLTLSVSLLIIISSLINGFNNEIYTNNKKFLTSLEVINKSHNQHNIKNELSKIASNNKISEYIDIYGTIQNKNTNSINAIKIRGIENEQDTNSISIGDELARELNVKVGDRVVVNVGSGNTNNIKSFIVGAIYHTGTNEFDRETALANRNELNELSVPGNVKTGYLVDTEDPRKNEEIMQIINDKYTGDFEAINWERAHLDIYNSIKTEKQLLYLNLATILVASLFNILNTLFFVVNDKKSDIAILKTLGVSNFNVLLIFLIQGVWISVIGVSLGVIIGLVISFDIVNASPLIQWFLNYQFIDNGEAIDKLPFLVNIVDILKIALGSILISILTVLYPSYRATKILPAEALRYE